MDILQDMNFRTPAFLLLIVPVIMLLPGGCMVNQSLTLNPDLSGTWSLEGEAMPFAGAAFDDLAALGGFSGAGALYDEAIAVSRSDLSKRSDVRRFRIDRIGAHSWNGEVGFIDIVSILGGTDTGGIAEVVRSGSTTTLNLRFDRARALKLEELVPLMTNPAFSLFNPAGTEGIDEESYITGILGFTFGEDNIPQIRAAAVGLTVNLPGPVVAVTGGTRTGAASVRFQAPLTRLLVPDRPVFWSVSWNSGS